MSELYLMKRTKPLDMSNPHHRRVAEDFARAIDHLSPESGRDE